jgi:CrcB protein
VTAGPDGRAAPQLPLHPGVVAAVFAGGCVGGYARYAVTLAWHTPRDGFPTATLAVNTVGALVLAAVVVVATDLRPGRYLRPLLGTGFCGALTTFSAVVVAAVQLVDHGRYLVATAYLAATVVGGLAACWAGLVLTRAVARRLSPSLRAR